MKKWLIILLGSMLYSCSEKMEQRTSVLNITVGTASSFSKAGTAADAEDRIITLRVFVLDQGGQVVAHAFEDFSAVPEESARSIQISNVPLGSVDLYFFANEAAAGLEFDSQGNVISGNVTGNTLREYTLRDPEKTSFPRDSSSAGALPMNCHQSVEVLENMQPLSVELSRNVIKIRLTLENVSTKTGLPVNSISFGSFFSSAMLLFPTDASPYPVSSPPDPFSDYKVHESFSLQPQEKRSFCIYAYPTRPDAAVNPFTLSIMVSGDLLLGPKPIMGELPAQQLTAVAPNTQLNIRASLTGDAFVNLTFSVSHWIKETVDVPAFN